MKKFFVFLFLIILALTALVVVAVLSPGESGVKWLSVCFSETLKEQNELIVYSGEKTGIEIYQRNAPIVGTIQEVEMPYTFSFEFSVDLSKAVVDVSGKDVTVHVPGPRLYNYKMTVVDRDVERSGALITAETAVEQGRDVFAVPGPIDAPKSIGCNQLIRDGAGLVSDAWDILREYEARFPDKLRMDGAREVPRTLGYQARQKTEPKAVPPSFSLSTNALELTDDQIALLQALQEETPIQVDDLIEQTGISTRRVLSALTVLEIENLVQQHSGKHYTRAVALTE